MIKTEITKVISVFIWAGVDCLAHSRVTAFRVLFFSDFIALNKIASASARSRSNQ